MIKPPWKSSAQRLFAVLARPRCLAIIGILLNEPLDRQALAARLGIPLTKLDNDLFRLRHAELLCPKIPGQPCRLRNIQLSAEGGLLITIQNLFLMLAATDQAPRITDNG